MTRLRRPIMLLPADYDLLRLSLPPMPEREIYGALRYRIPQYYPAQADDVAYDYFLLSRAGPLDIAVVVTLPETLTRYREEHGAHAFTCALQLLLGSGATPENGVLVFCADGSCEVLHFRDGRFDERVPVRTPSAEVVSALIPADAEEARCLADSADEASALAGELRRLRPELSIDVEEVDALDHTALRRESPLFVLRQKRRGLTRARRMVLWTAVALTASLVLAGRYVRTLEAVSSDLTRQVETSQRAAQDERARAQEARELRARLETLEAEAPDNVYVMLSDFSEVAGSDVRILSLVADGRQISVEGFAPDALGLSQRLDGHPRFLNVRLQRVVDAAGDPRDRFSLVVEYAYD